MICFSFFWKNFCLGQWAILFLKMLCSQNFGFTVRTLKKVFYNERSQYRFQNYINGFSGKKITQGNQAIMGQKMIYHRNSGSAQMFLFFLILHNGMGQEVHESYCNSFSEKLLQGNCTILCPKVMFHHNSCSTLRIFLKCCTMKGVKRCMKNIVMVFPKKVSIRAMWSFSAQNDTSS